MNSHEGDYFTFPDVITRFYDNPRKSGEYFYCMFQYPECQQLGLTNGMIEETKFHKSAVYYVNSQYARVACNTDILSSIPVPYTAKVTVKRDESGMLFARFIRIISGDASIISRNTINSYEYAAAENHPEETTE